MNVDLTAKLSKATLKYIELFHLGEDMLMGISDPTFYMVPGEKNTGEKIKSAYFSDSICEEARNLNTLYANCIRTNGN